MSTFAKATFNASKYASFRPTYPPALYEAIYSYHASSPSAQWESVVDLGCGTGQATTVLSERFKHVTGVDPSPGMVASAQATLGPNSNIKYVTSSAEDLSFLPDESVDLITAAQAAHWFDYNRLWPEVGRVLKKGGSVACWCYSEFRLTHHQSLTPHIIAYASDQTQNLGPYWERPGRTLLENHLQDVALPSFAPFDPASHQRLYFAGDHYPTEIRIPQGPTNDKRREIILRKTLSWEGMEAYLRTWSSLHTFQAQFPEDVQAQGGDIVQRFIKKLKVGIESETGKPSEEVEIEWPLAMIMAKKAE